MNMAIKKLLFFIFYFSSVIAFACNDQDSQKVALIRMMYVKNDSIWRNEDDPRKLTAGLATLYRQYCSMNFKKELLEEQRRMGLDHDLITADWSMDINSLKTMRIKKISDYVFHVSYVTNMEDPTGKMKVYHVILCVRLAKEENSYKIDDVTDLTNS